ncbi:MAG: RNA 2',3'-cyclic phosphodiesterase [Patescibacteria group bacterium]|nr:RNA 2',3'-cyclic phosphodiesterase [Patescibacteria group bacterium]
MSRRLFIAIPLSGPVATEAVAVCGSMDKKCPRARWVDRKNLHVTVLFMGDVEDSKVEALRDRFRKCCSEHTPFELMATGVVSGPPVGRPTMLWINFDHSREFASLAHGIYNFASFELDLSPQRNDVVPHVTLARFRDGLPRLCAEAAKHVKFETSFTVDTFVLYESRLTQDGPMYIEIEKFAFSER